MDNLFENKFRSLPDADTTARNPSNWYRPLQALSAALPSYGDISSSNKDGLILHSIGKEMLRDIMSDSLDLIETSVVVLEKECQYALEIICSPWCRLLKQSSRKNCNQSTNIDAMASGRWICHESCTSFASQAMSENTFVTTTCAGGMNLFAVPVRTEKEVIGVLSLAFGGPPINPQTIKDIALCYGVDYDELLSVACGIQSRPSYIVDMAKNRLFYSSRLISSIVERRRTEKALQSAYSDIEQRVKKRTAVLKKTVKRLREETGEHKKTEQELYQKHQALESVYAIATSVFNNPEELFQRIVSEIATILTVPYSAVGLVGQNQFTVICQFCSGQITMEYSIPRNNHPCGISLKKDGPIQFFDNLQKHLETSAQALGEMKSYFGMQIRADDGEVLGVVCAMDHKSRIFSEYEFHQMEIFARFAAREIQQDLLKCKLSQNQEMKMLGLLTSGVAHEVRNPLNGILAITEALDSDLGGSEEYRPYIDHIKGQVLRLSELMKDLLDLGRPVEESRIVKSSVKGILDSAIHSWRQSSKRKNQKVVVELRGDVQKGSIMCDPVKIQQVFINLIDNACSHNLESLPVTVCADCTDNDLVIKVVDKGTGIKQEHIDHVFEPFFTTRKGGTGLGLGIVKRIVETHGGRIHLKNNSSSVGCTSEVRFKLLKD